MKCDCGQYELIIPEKAEKSLNQTADFSKIDKLMNGKKTMDAEVEMERALSPEERSKTSRFVRETEERTLNR